ncbi:hypothetical protein L2E82_43461 [Cichorium intybus]|uniref:Uncharacterized protein n=1 Tax=Cichorium intybus TaxID=13427 RepID=A0ACB8ZNP8_CICIN|nr:hypothetical protein L2E82_43461 [Cichorium intybus]
MNLHLNLINQCLPSESDQLMPPSAFNTLAINHLARGLDVVRIQSCNLIQCLNSTTSQHHPTTPKSPILKPLTTGNRQDENYNPIIEDILSRMKGIKMAKLPEGITELVEKEKLHVPLPEVAQPLSKLCFEFPNVHIGRNSFRSGPLTITLEGKDEEMIEAAMEAISTKLSSK